MYVIKFLLACALFLPSVVQAKTLSELRTDARLLARDSNTVRQRFSDTQINGFINEAHRDAVATGHLLESTTRFNLAPGTTFYSMPSDFIQVKRVLFKNQILDEMSPAALDKEADGWEEVTAEPLHYFVHFASRTKIGFHPFPDSTGQSTGTAKVEYFSQAATLSNDSDTPFYGYAEFTPYHYGLAIYAAYRMTAIDGQIQLAMLYLQEWQAYLAQMGVESRMRPNYRPGVSASRTEDVR